MDFAKFSSYPLFWVVITILAIWRISSILSRERIARWYRSLAGVSEGGDWQDVPETLAGYLVTCLWCTSVWVSMILIPVMYFFPIILLPFAFSAVAIWFDSCVKT